VSTVRELLSKAWPRSVSSAARQGEAALGGYGCVAVSTVNWKRFEK
jgi:hypothetical protein